MDPGNSKILVPETLRSIIRDQGLKKLKKFKISKTLFNDFNKGIYEIDDDESENNGPETLESILTALEL